MFQSRKPIQNEFDLTYQAKANAFNLFCKDKFLPIIKSLDGIVKSPSCFISYAYLDKDSKTKAERLAEQLTKSGCNVILGDYDSLNLRAGQEVIEVVSETLENIDRILIIGTEKYLSCYQSESSSLSSAERIEAVLIRIASNYSSKKVIPLSFCEDNEKCFPVQIRILTACEFNKNYYNELLELIRALYKIPVREQKVNEIFSQFNAMLMAIDKTITKEDQGNFIKENEFEKKKQEDELKGEAATLLSRLLGKFLSKTAPTTEYKKPLNQELNIEFKPQSLDEFPLVANLNAYLAKNNFCQKNGFFREVEVVTSVCREHPALERISVPQIKFNLTRGIPGDKLIAFIREKLITDPKANGFYFSDGREPSITIPLGYLKEFNEKLLEGVKFDELPRAPGGPGCR